MSHFGELDVTISVSEKEEPVYLLNMSGWMVEIREHGKTMKNKVCALE